MRRRVLRAGADGAARHLRAGLRQQPADGVPRRRAAGAVGVRAWWPSIATRASRPRRPSSTSCSAPSPPARCCTACRMIYGLTGTLDLEQLAVRLCSAVVARRRSSGSCFIVVAVAFKFGAVPFHMWLPDVYEGAPDQRDAVHRHGAEDRLLRAGAAAAGARAWPALPLEWTQMLAALAVLIAARRQRRRDRADQPQAHAGVLDHRQCRLHPARLRRRRRRRLPAALVLHAGLRADDARLLRRRSCSLQPQGLRGGRARRLQGPVHARPAAGRC